MRIVAGKFRGKTLISPEHNIRPTLDKVKQALFTRLQFQIENARVLDLFCGSGSLGIEALSRGAEFVVFCDSNSKSTNLTKQNLQSLRENGKTISNFKVYNMDYLAVLDLLGQHKQKFDLIILDPPYEKIDFYVKALEKIKDLNLLSNDGIIVCERLKEKSISYSGYTLENTKNYGSVSLDYLVN